MYDSRTAWRERSFATSWTTGYLATDTAPNTRIAPTRQGRCEKPQLRWPGTHPGYGCTVVAGYGVDEPRLPPQEEARLERNDGASRGKRRAPKVQTISELTGVKSNLDSATAQRIRNF